MRIYHIHIISRERHTCITNRLTISVNGSVNVTPETYQNLNEKDIFPKVILISLGALLLESQVSHIFIFFHTGHHLNFPLFHHLNFLLFHHLNFPLFIKLFHSLSGAVFSCLKYHSKCHPYFHFLLDL